MTPSPAEVIAHLGTRSPREIADLLRDRRITGERQLASACPLARYVRDASGVAVRIGLEHWFTDYDAPAQPLPITVRRFVAQTDAGRYPDLLEGETPRSWWQRLTRW